MISRLALRWRKGDRLAVDEQVALLRALEQALRSRTRLTVQAMPHGCEIIDCETGECLRIVKLIERQP